MWWPKLGFPFPLQSRMVVVRVGLSKSCGSGTLDWNKNDRALKGFDVNILPADHTAASLVGRVWNPAVSGPSLVQVK